MPHRAMAQEQPTDHTVTDMAAGRSTSSARPVDATRVTSRVDRTATGGDGAGGEGTIKG
jgi:hypothetical protein